MEDTSSIIERAVAESTPVDDSEPIPGDESPSAVTESSDGDTETTEAPVEGDSAEAAPAPAAQPERRRGPIPFDRHKAVLTKARNEFEAKEKALNERLSALAKYESDDFKAQIQFLDVLYNNPSQAIEVLKRVDPDRFGKLSWAEQQAAVAAAADAASAAPAASAPGEKPKPDVLNPDGTLGYSAEQAEKLVEWRVANERTAFEKELKAIRDEIAPIKDERETRAKLDQAMHRMRPVLEDARQNWPEFTKYEKDIRRALEQNPTYTLADAYRAVVTPKLISDREAIRNEERKKLIEEMNAKRKATTLSPGQLPAASSETTSGPRSTADIIRETIRQAA